MALAPIVEAFQWGKGGAKMSPEEIAREREIAQALMQVDTSPVGHWTQGLARVANAAAGAFKDYRAGQAEKGNAAFNSDIVASLLGGGGGSATDIGGGTSPSAFAPSGGGASTAASAAGVSQQTANNNPMELAATLVGKGEVPDRGTLMEYMKNGGVNLDPATTAWCAAFVNASLGQSGIEGTGSNLARSFLDWGEGVDQPQRGDLAVFSRGDPNGWQGHVGFFDSVNPDGSIRVLGGNQGNQVSFADYGADRLLGYRRAPGSSPAVNAVNAFAGGGGVPNAGGVPVAETEADIMAQEAAMAQQDPSAFAVNPVAEALTTGAIPAPDANPNAAVASSLTGHAVNPDLPMAGGTSGFAPIAQAMQAPQQAQGGGMQQAIIQALSDPRASDQTRNIASILLQQQMQSQDPMRQLEMEYKQAQLDQLRNPQPDLTSGQREYNMAVQQGYQGSFMDYKRDLAEAQRAQTNITVGGDGAPGLGKLSADYGYVLDPQTRQPVIDPATGLPQAAPVPGSPASREIEEAERMRGEREGQGQRYGRIVLEDIGRVLEAVESKPNLVAGPLGSMLSSLPGTGAHDVSSMLNTIRANVGFDRLQAMRATSPTGGALGAVSDSENKMLQSTLGALEQSQSPQQFAQNLRRLQNLYTEIVHGPAPEGVSDDEWSKQAWGVQQQGSGTNKPISEMTDEELEALANGN